MKYIIAEGEAEELCCSLLIKIKYKPGDEDTDLFALVVKEILNQYIQKMKHLIWI